MISPRYIVAFSGHRTLADPAAVRGALRTTLERLRGTACQKGGILELYGSAARGSDLLTLQCAWELGIPVHLLLPMPEEEFAADFKGHNEEWAQAQDFLAAARRGENGGTLRILRDHQPRPDCYYAQAARLMEAADALLAVWNGQPAAGPGGTADAVDLAKAHGKPLLRIDSAAPQAPAVTSDIFPADLICAEVSAHLPAAPAGASAAGSYDLRQSLALVANFQAPAFRKGVARVIWMHSVAAFLGAVPSLLAFNSTAKQSALWFTAIEFVLVALALVISLRLQKKKYQTKWLSSRFSTEICRGILAARDWLDPLHPHVARHLPEWRRLAVSVALTTPAPEGTSLAEKKERYLSGRILHQQAFFEGKAAEVRVTHHRWYQVAHWAAILAPFAVLFALLDKSHALWSGEATKHWMGAFFGKFLPVALPLIAGATTALRGALDLTRRSHRYPEMAERLESIARVFRELKTEPAAASAVHRTEELLLDELIEWHLAAKHAGAH